MVCMALLGNSTDLAIPTQMFACARGRLVLVLTSALNLLLFCLFYCLGAAPLTASGVNSNNDVAVPAPTTFTATKATCAVVSPPGTGTITCTVRYGGVSIGTCTITNAGCVPATGPCSCTTASFSTAVTAGTAFLASFTETGSVKRSVACVTIS